MRSEEDRAGRIRRRIGLAVLVAALATGAFASPDEPTFSLDVRGEPLGRVLGRVAAQTGFTIEVGREWAQEPMRAHLEGVPLVSGLGRLLSGYNHYLMTDVEAHSVRVRIFGACAPNGRTPGTAVARSAPVAVPPSEPSRRGSLLIVGVEGAESAGGAGGPDVPGGAAADGAPDGTDLPILPPDADGVPAPTLRQVAETDLDGPDPSQLELVPPGHD